MTYAIRALQAGGVLLALAIVLLSVIGHSR